LQGAAPRVIGAANVVRSPKHRDRPYQSGRSKHLIKVKKPEASGDGSGYGLVRPDGTSMTWRSSLVHHPIL